MLAGRGRELEDGASQAALSGEGGPEMLLGWAPVPMTSWITTDKVRRRLLGAFAIALVLLAGAGIYIKAREELAIRAQASAARRLIAAGKYDEARAPLESWLKARPRAAEAFFLLAREMFAALLYEQGFTALERARALGYPQTEIERLKGIILARLGRYQEAERLLRRIVLSALRPDPEADEALAKCYMETYQLAEAEGVIERWMRDAPDQVKPYLWKIGLGRKLSAGPEILQVYYQKALEIDPNEPSVHLGLAELYLQTHRLDEATAEYKRYLELQSDDSSAYLGLGKVAVERGDEMEAIDYFERSARLAPGDIRPLIERGKLEIRTGRFQSALGFIDQALKIDANEPEVHYQRGLVLARLGRAAEAKAEQDAAARAREENEHIKKLVTQTLEAPGDLARQYEIARWLFDHGHTEEGLRWAEKILKEQPRHMLTNKLLAGYYDKTGNRGLANFYQLQAEPQP